MCESENLMKKKHYLRTSKERVPEGTDKSTEERSNTNAAAFRNKWCSVWKRMNAQDAKMKYGKETDNHIGRDS